MERLARFVDRWRAMTARSLAASLVVVCLVAAPSLAQSQAPRAEDLPLLTAPVNDFAGVIDRDSAGQLDKLIRQLQAASGDVIVVATVKTFQPWPD